MSTPAIDPAIDPAQRRALVELLVRRSGLPVSRSETDTLIAGAAAVEAAVARLHAVEMDHETEPAVELTQPRPASRD